MPKIKTNKSAVKRFKVRAGGRVCRAKAFKSHNTAKKSPKRMRRLRQRTEVSAVDRGRVKGLLPNAGL